MSLFCLAKLPAGISCLRFSTVPVLLCYLWRCTKMWFKKVFPFLMQYTSRLKEMGYDHVETLKHIAADDMAAMNMMVTFGECSSRKFWQA